MITIATYSFLPWLRAGVANTITAADGDSTVKDQGEHKCRACSSRGKPVGGGAPLVQPVSQTIALYGPGDIVGIDARAIVRLEPRNWITNFESNYCPRSISMMKTFPGATRRPRRTGRGLQATPVDRPDRSQGKRISGRTATRDPAIALRDRGGYQRLFPQRISYGRGRTCISTKAFPAGPSELVSPDMSAVLPRVQAIIAQNPDLAYSRILCPRRLADNSKYHAFVMPVFETGQARRPG